MFYGKGGSEMNRKYILPGVIIFLALMLIFRPEMAADLWQGVCGTVTPIVTGIVIAAAASPAVNALERLFAKLSGRNAHRKKWHRPAAITAVYLIAAAALAAAVSIIIPKLGDSIRLFVNSFDGYYSIFRERIEGFTEGDTVMKFFDRLYEVVSNEFPVMINRTVSVTADFIRETGNFLVGAVLAVYILAEREAITEFIAGAAGAFMSEERKKKFSHVIMTVYECLTNFISGQITEAVVLGTLCFAGMVIFRFEYPLLISVMIGVTALVPVVGAFAGAVPSAFVLFLAKPSSALWFIIFIVILQQLENNFIYPRIVGKSVGLPPMLILVAIIAGAKIGGAAGIMLGIPLLSAAYTLAREKLLSEAR